MNKIKKKNILIFNKLHLTNFNLILGLVINKCDPCFHLSVM